MLGMIYLDERNLILSRMLRHVHLYFGISSGFVSYKAYALGQSGRCINSPGSGAHHFAISTTASVHTAATANHNGCVTVRAERPIVFHETTVMCFRSTLPR